MLKLQPQHFALHQLCTSEFLFCVVLLCVVLLLLLLFLSPRLAHSFTASAIPHTTHSLAVVLPTLNASHPTSAPGAALCCCVCDEQPHKPTAGRGHGVGPAAPRLPVLAGLLGRAPGQGLVCKEVGRVARSARPVPAFTRDAAGAAKHFTQRRWELGLGGLPLCGLKFYFTDFLISYNHSFFSPFFVRFFC